MTYGSQAAAASQVFEQQRDLALRDRSRLELGRVEAALRALDDGTYGTCVELRQADRTRATRGDPVVVDVHRLRAEGDAMTARRSPRRARRDRARLHRRHPTGRGKSRRRGAADAAAAIRDGGPGGPRVLLKAESLQPIGAFKIRGAYHTIASLTPEERARGVVTHSSGNHAPGRGARGAAARHPGRHRHARQRARDQAPPGRGGRRRDRDRRAGGERARGDGRSSSSPIAGWCSSIPSTTIGSSPARARSGWRSPRTCRISPRCSCRSGAAGCRAACPWRFARSAPRADHRGGAGGRGRRPGVAARGPHRELGRRHGPAARSPTASGRRRSAGATSRTCRSSWTTS